MRAPLENLARQDFRRDGGPKQCTRILTSMKNITLSADEDLIKRARAVAKAQHKTLNGVFREWLAQFTAGSRYAQGFDVLMKRLKQVDSGQHFTRGECNAR